MWSLLTWKLRLALQTHVLRKYHPVKFVYQYSNTCPSIDVYTQPWFPKTSLPPSRLLCPTRWRFLGFGQARLWGILKESNRGTLQVSIIPSLSFEQAAVGLDLVLQSGLNVQELLVLGVLALGLSPNLLQLFLQGGDLALDLGELHAVATFCFCQGGFQRLFLRRRVLLSAVKYGKFFSKTSSQKGSG